MNYCTHTANPMYNVLISLSLPERNGYIAIDFSKQNIINRVSYRILKGGNNFKVANEARRRLGGCGGMPPPPELLGRYSEVFGVALSH